MAQNSLLADPRLSAWQMQNAQGMMNNAMAAYAPANPNLLVDAPMNNPWTAAPAQGGLATPPAANTIVQGYQDAMRGILAGRKALGQRAKETMGGQADYNEALAAAQGDANAPHYGVDTLLEHPLDTLGYGVGQAAANLKDMGIGGLAGATVGGGLGLLARQPLAGARLGAKLGAAALPVLDATGQEVLGQQADPTQASQSLNARNLAAGGAGLAQGMAHVLVPEAAMDAALGKGALGFLPQLGRGTLHAAATTAAGTGASQLAATELSGQNHFDPHALADSAVLGASGGLPMHLPGAVVSGVRGRGAAVADALKNGTATVLDAAKAGYNGEPVDTSASTPLGTAAASGASALGKVAAGIKAGYDGSELQSRFNGLRDDARTWGQAQADKFNANGGLEGAAAAATRGAADAVTGALDYGSAVAKGLKQGADNAGLTDEANKAINATTAWWDGMDKSPQAVSSAVASITEPLASGALKVTRTGVPILRGLYDGVTDSSLGQDAAKAAKVVSNWLKNSPSDEAQQTLEAQTAKWTQSALDNSYGVAARNAATAYDFLSAMTTDAAKSARYQVLKAAVQARRFMSDAGAAYDQFKALTQQVAAGDDAKVADLASAVNEATAKSNLPPERKAEVASYMADLNAHMADLMKMASENDNGNMPVAGAETALNSTQAPQGTDAAIGAQNAPPAAPGAAAGPYRNPANLPQLAQLAQNHAARMAAAQDGSGTRYSQRAVGAPAQAARQRAKMDAVQQFAVDNKAMAPHADAVSALIDHMLDNPGDRTRERSFDRAMHEAFGDNAQRVLDRFSELRGEQPGSATLAGVADDEAALTGNPEDGGAGLTAQREATPSYVNHALPHHVKDPEYAAMRDEVVGSRASPLSGGERSRLLGAHDYLHGTDAAGSPYVDPRVRKQTEDMWFRNRAKYIHDVQEGAGLTPKPHKQIEADLRAHKQAVDAEHGTGAFWNAHKVLERTPVGGDVLGSHGLSNEDWGRLKAQGRSAESGNVTVHLEGGKQKQSLNPVEIARLGQRAMKGSYEQADAGTVLRFLTEGLGQVLDDPRVSGVSDAKGNPIRMQDGALHIDPNTVVWQDANGNRTFGELQAEARKGDGESALDKASRSEIKVRGSDGNTETHKLGDLRDALASARDATQPAHERVAAADDVANTVNNAVVYHGASGLLTHGELMAALAREKQGDPNARVLGEHLPSTVEAHLRTLPGRGDTLDTLSKLARSAYAAAEDARRGSDVATDSRIGDEQSRPRDAVASRTLGEDGYGQRKAESDTGTPIGRGGAPSLLGPDTTVADFKRALENATPQQRRDALENLRYQRDALADAGRPIPPRLNAHIRAAEEYGLGKVKPRSATR